ncbi:hypothetical protein G6F31_016086 [Rhizopus arrhizus]|nr:hypothetical protein G6F31_016086 [Rhizopus arrhizus]
MRAATAEASATGAGRSSQMKPPPASSATPRSCTAPAASQHAARERIGQRIQPLHAIPERRQARRLAGAQVCGHFQDQVPGLVQPHRIQLAQHAFGQRAGARAEFQHGLRLRLTQHLGRLPGHRAGEQWRQLRRGNEVARGRLGVVVAVGQLHVAGGVIAQAGRIQRFRHPVVERQPAAVGRDRGAQVRGSGVAMFLGGGGQRGKIGGSGALHGRRRRGHCGIFPKKERPCCARLPA